MQNLYNPNGKKYVLVKRDDEKFQGSVIDIPEDHVQATLQRHPTWKVIDLDEPRFSKPETVEDVPKAEFACPLCEYSASTEALLKRHKTTKHS